MLHLEKDTAYNLFIWLMCCVVDQKEIFPSVLVQLYMTVVMERMLVSSVEVCD